MGAGSFLPFRSLFSSTRAPSLHSVHDSTPHAGDQQQALQLLSRFQLDLAGRLHLLQLHGSGNAHLNWLLDALASALSTHSSLQTALTAAASSGATPAVAIKHRADEVLSLLDVCTSLKEVTDDIDRRFGGLHQALQRVTHALNAEINPLSSCRLGAAARRLSACLSVTDERPHTNILCIINRPLADARASLRLASKAELQSGDATPADPLVTLVHEAIDGTVLSSLLVLASAVSSLSPPSRGKSSGTITGACKMIIKYLGDKRVSAAWATPLRQLHRDLKQEETSAAGGSLFQEVQGLHSAASKLLSLITNPSVYGMEVGAVRQSVESLRKRVQEAQGCITMLRMHVASFCQVLVALRLALLHMEGAC